MSIPELVPIFDFTIFNGIAFDLSFQAELLNPDSTSQDPIVYYSFVGKSLRLLITGIFPTDFTLSTDDGANDLGSVLAMVDPALGNFQLHLSSADLSRVNQLNGYHHIVIQATGQEDEVLIRGTIRVVPFSEDGEL